ncbi:MAG: FG-GAP-like repeat-containing protein, partial [Verrucomicrobiota bacterium]
MNRLLLLPLLLGCSCSGPPPPETMPERLARMADESGRQNMSAVHRRIEPLKEMLAQAGDPARIRRLRVKLARSYLNAGHTREAIHELEALLADGEDEALERLLAVAWLRVGEQENCIAFHGEGACTLPIGPGGVHTEPEGSTRAVEHYRKRLEKDPESLIDRWLLNLGHMTLGTYPEAVPDPWRIPPDRFVSAYNIRRFPERAADLGVNMNGLSGGVVLEDFDGNGFVDILVTSSGMEDQTRCFFNRGDGRFDDVTASAGLSGLVGGLNAVQGDYDNDGHVDVLILRGAWFGDHGRFPNSLLRNRGDGTFEDVTEAAGLLDFFPTQTAAWGDYDNDGWLDLFVGSEAGQGADEPCRLYRNNRDGTFTDRARETGLGLTAFVKGAIWGDIDNDGFQDLFVSCLYQTNRLFRNHGPDETGAWTFTDIAASAGVEEPIHGFPCWFWDVDNDGWLDLTVLGFPTRYWDIGESGDQHDRFVAEFFDRPMLEPEPQLFINNRNRGFVDSTADYNLHWPWFAMGANFGDLDHDGWLDFYVGNGAPDFQDVIPNRMFRNDAGKTFQDVTFSGGF